MDSLCQLCGYRSLEVHIAFQINCLGFVAHNHVKASLHIGHFVSVQSFRTLCRGLTYSHLARHQFGALQHKTFPVYFVISMLLSSGLMAIWTFKHPDVLVYLTRPNYADVAQFYALATVFASQSANYFVIGPMTST